MTDAPEWCDATPVCSTAPPPEMATQAAVLAVLHLVGALAEKLTGQKPAIRVQVRPGEWVEVDPTLGHVTWATSAAG